MKNYDEIETELEKILDACVNTEYNVDAQGNEFPYDCIDKYKALPDIIFWLKENFTPKS